MGAESHCMQCLSVTVSFVHGCCPFHLGFSIYVHCLEKKIIRDLPERVIGLGVTGGTKLLWRERMEGSKFA